MGADLETGYNLERDVTGDSLKELKEEINEPIKNSSEEEQNSSEKKEKSFTFKPIAASLAGSQINNWETWDNNLTTTVEFAWWWKNLSLYWYARKDWNKYATWFNEWIEVFGNENLKLWNNFDINGKQFYRWQWNGRLMVWPQVSADKQIWNVWIWWSLGAYWTYDAIWWWNKDTFSWSSVVSVNFSVKWKNWKTWNGNAFLNISNIKNFNTSEYGTYWESSLETPNLLDPKVAWALCWMLYARYGWTLKEIDLMYLWAWIKYKF